MKELYTLLIYDPATGTEQAVLVTKEIYDEFRRGEWRIHKNNDKHEANETPFSSLIGGEDGAYENFREFVSYEDNPEAIYMDADPSRELHRAIAMLCEEDRLLIKALFFDGLSERQYAEQIKVCRNAVHKRKVRILRDLKNFFER